MTEIADTRRRGLVGCAIAMVSGLALSGCVEKVGKPYRYKLTLTFLVNGVPHTGSSVVQVQVEDHHIIGGSVGHHNVRGEATLVDLGQGRIVLCLLEGEGMWWNPTSAMAHLFGLKPGSNGYEISEINAQQHRVKMDASQLPYLITFDDPSQPASYVIVDPADPSATLGSDVVFSEAFIEITDEPVTRTLAKRLPWIETTVNFLHGKRRPRGRDIQIRQILQGI